MLSAILQLIGSACLLGSYFPQIIKILKTKKVDGLSICFFSVLTVGLFCIFLNMIITKTNFGITLTQLGNVILAFLIVILIKCYSKKERK